MTKMANWKKRIELGKSLLADFRDMLPEESEDKAEDLSIALETIDEYVASMSFKENDDEEKENDSWSILMNAVRSCNDCLDDIQKKMFPCPPKFVTREDAFKMLISEYAEAMAKGDDMVASTNINDWVAEHGLVIVEEGDSRLESSSDSDDETVNSKTKF